MWDTDALTAAAREAFSGRSRDEEWSVEGPRLGLRFVALGNDLQSRYVNPRFLGLGGSGVVLSCEDQLLDGQRVAVKMPRAVPGKAALMKTMLSQEIKHLLQLRHPSVIRIHAAGSVSTEGDDIPYYIMDFVDGEESARYLERAAITQSHAIALVAGVVGALAYMHEQGVAHLDIKEQNVLVDASGRPIISDLGTAKLVRSDSTDTVVATTIARADPEFLQMLDEDPSDEDRARGALPRNKIRREFDLHPLGLMLRAWLAAIGKRQPSDGPLLDAYTRKYLLLMIARLCSKHLPAGLADDVGVNEHVLRQLIYESVVDVKADLLKLTGELELTVLVPELNLYGARTIQISPGGPTSFTPRVKALVESPMVSRLQAITQLGLVNQVYPTATHTRLEHSLGTFHNACRAVMSLYNDPISPLFKQIMSQTDIAATLLYALLHDSGQFPLAHDLEEIDKSVFNHEDLSRAIIRGRRDIKKKGARKLTLPTLAEHFVAWGVNAERVEALLDATPRSSSQVRDRILRSIVDGPIDADKLDYLRRDSERCLVPYGLGIDADRVIRSLTVIIDGSQTATVGVHEKGKAAAEFVAMARTTMFSAVYWHHSVRSMKAMLARATSKLLTLLEEEKGGTARYRFQSDFERFVLNLPGSMYPRAGSQPAVSQDALPGVGDSEDEQPPGATSKPMIDYQSKVGDTDAAVLMFLKTWLDERKAGETRLLDDLLLRRFFGRLFVFTRERDQDDWDIVVSAWHDLTKDKRLRVQEAVERRVAENAAKRQADGPDTVVLGADEVDFMKRRVAGRIPFLLIDVPTPRPGGELGLLYVIEEQRRTLRKDERAMGTCAKSGLWTDFASNMHQRAGKVRVFCHPRVLDAIGSVMDHKQFVEIFREAVDAAG